MKVSASKPPIKAVEEEEEAALRVFDRLLEIVEEAAKRILQNAPEPQEGVQARTDWPTTYPGI